jgi:hypothetical protein
MTTINVVADKWADFDSAIRSIRESDRFRSDHEGSDLYSGGGVLITAEAVGLQIHIPSPRHSRSAEERRFSHA